MAKFVLALRRIACAALLLAASSPAAAVDKDADELLDQAQAALQRTNRAEALALVTKAMDKDPKSPRAYYVRGRIREEAHDHERAIADYDYAIRLEPRAVLAYQQRGSEHFKMGHIKEALADFDQYLKLAPGHEAEHWQRGIACYYAGEFSKGRKQFELHQTVNPNDVENAVWHYLCVARTEGRNKARSLLFPVEGDRRVPMMEIHALFRGHGSDETVLSAAKTDSPSPADQQRHLFYAHLYLGLYYESAGEEKRARQYLTQAAAEAPPGDYMGDVARVHVQLRWQK